MGSYRSPSTGSIVRAVLFDTFGTVVDWRTGIASAVGDFAHRNQIDLDATRFADAWRARYQPAMHRVRSGERGFVDLDTLHRENLEAVQFLQEMNATVHKLNPGIVTVAEESTSWPGVTRPTTIGGLGFSMKWNMGWMNDTLSFVSRDPIYRSYHHHEMTFSMLYAFSENYVLPISHDEVVHGKGTLWGRMPGNDHVKAAGLRSLLAYQWAHPGKQLLFMGQEFGQRAEWSEERGVDWYQLDENSYSTGILRMVQDINGIYRTHPALWSQDTKPEGYSWIDANDSANNVLSFLRWGSDGSVMACVFNFAGHEHGRYQLGLPHAGRWREVLNTNSEYYGGSGLGNGGGRNTEDVPRDGFNQSLNVTLPPHTVTIFKWTA